METMVGIDRIDNRPIDQIDLSVRSTNALQKAGITTVGEMIRLSEDDLYHIRNLGKKSIDEILKRIEEYRGNPKAESAQMIASAEIIEDEFVSELFFSKWLSQKDNEQLVREYLQNQETSIRELHLSARVFSRLALSGIDLISQVMFQEEDWVNLLNGEPDLMEELKNKLTAFMERPEWRRELYPIWIRNSSGERSADSLSGRELLKQSGFREQILTFVKANDMEIKQLGMSNIPQNRLLENGYQYLSEIIFLTRTDLMKLQGMGGGSADKIISRIDDYMDEHLEDIRAYINGNTEVLLNDEVICKRILKAYDARPFGGYSLQEMMAELDAGEVITEDRLKHLLGSLIESGKLEYVDFRCYRVYERFETVFKKCDLLDDREKDVIKKRLAGKTLEVIGSEYSLTRERIRQILDTSLKKIQKYHLAKSGDRYFDEDYYRYFYDQYYFEKEVAARWFGIPDYVWYYLALCDVKQGKKKLEKAMEDRDNLDLGLRLKIKNYLNKDMIYMDGMWIELKRAELERLVVKKRCQEDTSFDDFIVKYNDFLRKEEISEQSGLYFTEAIKKSRKNHLAEAEYLLWKQKEMLRYYDIQGQDYTELLETINLGEYKDVEISTTRLMNLYPEIMEKYDIRDQYELHNLLRKILQDKNEYHLEFPRTPILRFGNADRERQIYELIAENAPVTYDTLTHIANEAYGFDTGAIPWGNISKYLYKGVYTVASKEIPEENRELLRENLTEEFYLLDEIEEIYGRLFPGRDTDEVNPHSLKSMGYQVGSGYLVRGYSSVERYFEDFLTREDILDISEHKKRFSRVGSFSWIFHGLKRSLKMVEVEPNIFFNERKLERLGVSRKHIKAFCDAVYRFMDYGVCFSIQSLKKRGFISELFELGFADLFYANLLLADERFSGGNVFGTVVFYKGMKDVTIKAFLVDVVQRLGAVQVPDLMEVLKDIYGCTLIDKYKLLEKISDTEVYYDISGDRIYENKDRYYQEIEGGDN